MKHLKGFIFAVIFFLLSFLVFVLVSLPKKTVLLENSPGSFVLPNNPLAVYSLDGPWQFRYGGFYSSLDMVDADIISVPSSWEEHNYPTYGAATYRMVLVSPQEQLLMLYLPEISGAYELYLNKEQVSHSGKISPQRSEEEPALANQLLSLNLKQGENEFLFHVSNHHVKNSGLSYTLLIGEQEAMLRHFWAPRIAGAFMLGAFLLGGFFFLILFAFCHSKKDYLLLGLTCLNTFLRFLGDSNGLTQYFSPFPLGVIFMKANLLLSILHVLLLCQFTKITFSLPSNKAVRAINTICYTLPALMVVVLYPGDALPWVALTLVPSSIELFRAIHSKAVRQQPFLNLYLLSFGLYIPFGVFLKLTTDNSFFMAGLTPTIFMLLVQATMLAQRHSDAIKQVETENIRLEEMVLERTAKVNQINQQLVASQNALREMLRGISHDLKTPVTILGQFLELLMLDDVPKTQAEKEEYLQIAYQKNLDIQQLINQLFEVAKIEMKEMPMEPKWISVNDIEEKLINKYALAVKEKGVAFIVNLPKNNELWADYCCIDRIFDNLIYNALRYTPVKGKINITGTVQEDKLCVAVIDTGTGIPSEHIPYIFDRFYKSSLSRENEGNSGLGLYIVKNLLEQMGSRISVDSRVGQGTRFHFCLPCRRSNF